MNVDRDPANLVAEVVDVSPEMIAVIGPAPVDAGLLPPDPVAVEFTLGSSGTRLRVNPEGARRPFGEADRGSRVVLLIARTALVRIGGQTLLESEARDFHVASELRTILLALLNPSASSGARTPYRLAKSIELMCETVRLFAADELAPAGSGSLSAADTHRVIAARRIIDERSHEKLTLASVARACGLNRAKLTRGFREVFHCTVTEAIAARRLLQARHLLLTTDLPVSSVGYETGYLNNASFSRAFGRRFGRSPSSYRAAAQAA